MRIPYRPLVFLSLVLFYLSSPFARANVPICEWWLTASIQDWTSKIEIPARYSTANNSPFAKALGRVREKAAQMEFDAVETVLYPLAGFDSFTAAALFPNAKTIIALDMSKFVRHDDSSQLLATPYFGRNWEFAPTVWSQLQLSVPIIGGLLGAMPGVRVLSVLEFRMKNFAGEETSNGWIQYDTGPGTPQRQYIHLEGWIRSTKRDLANSWFGFLDGLKIDAVIVKGAMSFFNEPQIGQVFFRDAIENWLLRSRGILVTGFQEKSEGIISEFSSGLPSERIRLNVEIPDVEFGYGNKVSISRY